MKRRVIGLVAGLTLCVTALIATPSPAMAEENCVSIGTGELPIEKIRFNYTVCHPMP